MEDTAGPLPPLRERGDEAEEDDVLAGGDAEPALQQRDQRMGLRRPTVPGSPSVMGQTRIRGRVLRSCRRSAGAPMR